MASPKILVVEDPRAIQIDIRKQIEKLGYHVTDIVVSASKAYQSISNDRPDLVLMDINLRGKASGWEAARIVHAQYEIPVVFLCADLSGIDHKSLKDTASFSLVEKPFKPKVLQSAIELALGRHDEKMRLNKQRDMYRSMIDPAGVDTFMFVRAEHTLHKIMFSDIRYIEAQKDYVLIYTIDQKVLTHATMKDMMRRLPTRDFIRIHRSIIVRTDQIDTIKYPDLTLVGSNIVLPVGGLYRKDVFQQLNIK